MATTVTRQLARLARVGCRRCGAARWAGTKVCAGCAAEIMGCVYEIK